MCLDSRKAGLPLVGPKDWKSSRLDMASATEEKERVQDSPGQNENIA